jgi:voltage-gated potassium channel
MKQKIVNSIQSEAKKEMSRWNFKEMAKEFPPDTSLKRKIFIIIFGTDTRAGKLFDEALIFVILLSVIIIILETMHVIQAHSTPFVILEYIITVIFTVEYALRIYSSPHPWRYIFSFFGIIDLISTLPTYLGFFLQSFRYMLILRSFRIIRVFKVFRLFSFLNEGNMLLMSIKESARKIIVYFIFLVIMVISIGTIMYMVESTQPNSQFTDIPTGIYWAIVTMTTVGYGDITPVTHIGRIFSGVVMLLGYTILAVPTGIISVSMMNNRYRYRHDTRRCPRCHYYTHDSEAIYCKRCGEKLTK